MRVLCGTMLALLAWTACGQTNGEWSANRLPGTNTLWTAARTRAEIAASTQGVVQAASTAGWETGPHLAWLTEEQDARALAFAATNRVRTWPDPDDPLSWWVDANTNRVKYTRTVSGTNFIVTLSADFEETVTHTRPAWTNNVFPFSDGNWLGYLSVDLEPTLIITYPGTGWSVLLDNYPATLTAGAGAQGSATISISSLNYTTNFVRYVLTTGDVWTAIGTAQATADEAMEAADLVGGYHTTHLNDVTPHDGYVVQKFNGLADTLTVTNGIRIKNSAQTNLTARVFATNDVLLVEWINQ